MKKNIRMEYLFPNINNERVYKWLENAPLLYDVKDSKVADFTFDEYMQKFWNDNKKGYSVRKNRKLAIERYNDYWKPGIGASSNLINLELLGIKWDSDLTQKLALCLESNPLLLPYFIQKNSADIIDLFLGEKDLSMYLYSTNMSGYLFGYEDKFEKKYRKYNFDAKYKLSLFLSVLNNLLDLGVNLDEYKFGYFDFSKEDNAFNKISSSELWSEHIISKIGRSGSRRYDGYSFIKDELVNYLSFSNLNDFLDKVIKLTEIEGVSSNIKESKILASNQICPMDQALTPEIVIGPIGSYDMLAYPDEKLVDVEDACKNMQKKLKHVALKTQIRILTRKLADIKNLIEKYTKEQKDDYDSLKKIIDCFYKDIGELPSDIKEQFTIMINDLLKNQNNQITLEDSINVVDNFDDKNSSIKESRDKLTDFDDKRTSIDDVIKRIENLEKRMKKTEDKMSLVEQSLLNYIEHGGTLKFNELSGLSTEEKLRIVANAKATTTGAKIRKKILSEVFKIGASALVASALVLKVTTPTIDNLDDQKSLTETVKELPSLNISEDSKDVPHLPIDSVSVNSVDNKPGIDWEEHKEIIVDVMCGNYGNGDERKEKLMQEGYDYDQIQSYVNQVIYGNIDVTEEKSPVLIK